MVMWSDKRQVDDGAVSGGYLNAAGEAGNGDGVGHGGGAIFGSDQHGDGVGAHGEREHTGGTARRDG